MRKLQYLFMSLAAMLLASPAFAQAAGGNYSPASQWSRWRPVSEWPWRPDYRGPRTGPCNGVVGREALAATPELVPRKCFLFLILGLAFIESLGAVHLRNHLPESQSPKLLRKFEDRRGLRDVRTSAWLKTR